MARRSGRRPGDSGTRAAIRAAAAGQFAGQGYDRTSLRSVAVEAGVDPALVSHFFGSKQALFVEVVELPFEPADVVAAVFAAGREHAGLRLAQFLLTALENENVRQCMMGIVRAAASEPTAAAMVRDRMTRDVFAPIVEALGVDDADLRAALVGSQVVGLLMARCVVGIEPLASAPAQDVAEAIGPNLQRFMTGPLSRQSPAGSSGGRSRDRA